MPPCAIILFVFILKSRWQLEFTVQSLVSDVLQPDSRNDFGLQPQLAPHPIADKICSLCALSCLFLYPVTLCFVPK